MTESDHQGHPALCTTGLCGDPSHPFSDFPFIVAKADEGFQKELWGTEGKQKKKLGKYVSESTILSLVTGS